jgi:hypothetical protein
MKDGLPGALSIVHHRAVALQQIQLARQLRRDEL